MTRKIEEPFQLSRFIPNGRSNGRTSGELWKRVAEVHGKTDANKKSLTRQLNRLKREKTVSWVGQGSGVRYYF